jgi:hypothetical protein
MKIRKRIKYYQLSKPPKLKRSKGEREEGRKEMEGREKNKMYLNQSGKKHTTKLLELANTS